MVIMVWWNEVGEERRRTNFSGEVFIVEEVGM